MKPNTPLMIIHNYNNNFDDDDDIDLVRQTFMNPDTTLMIIDNNHYNSDDDKDYDDYIDLVRQTFMNPDTPLPFLNVSSPVFTISWTGTFENLNSKINMQKHKYKFPNTNTQIQYCKLLQSDLSLFEV